MATIINNPPANQAPSSDGGGVAGLVVGIIIAAVLVFLLIFFVLPMMRGGRNESERGGVTAPTNIQVPDKIEVDINK